MIINKSIIVSLRFDGKPNQVSLINFFTEYFNKYTTTPFNEFNYTITDKTKFNWKQKTKTRKFSENSLKKFAEEVGRSNEKIIIDFELLKNLPNHEVKSRDIDLSVSYSQTEEIKSLNLILNSEWENVINWQTFFKKTCDFLIAEKSKIYYGFVFEMENNKLPSFFIHGILTEDMSQREKNLVSTWSDNAMNCKSKIWNIFWGNLISEKHLQLINEEILSKLIGIKNIYKISENLVWFNLPLDLKKYDINNSTAIEKQLEEYFTNSKLLL